MARCDSVLLFALRAEGRKVGVSSPPPDCSLFSGRDSPSCKTALAAQETRLRRLVNSSTEQR